MGQFTNGSITKDNETFIFPKDIELKSGDILEFLNYHREMLADKYRKKLNQYKGAHKEHKIDDDKLLDKNHLIADMPKYLVDTLNGFFVGIPPTFKLVDKNANASFQDWLNENSFVDELNEVAKQSSIYGRSYMLVYQDEDSKTNVAVTRPDESFMIYDDTIKHNPLAFIRYGNNNDGDIVGTLYTSSIYQDFVVDGDLTLNIEHQLIYKGQVPAVEFFDNAERTSITDSVDTLIDELNKLLSQKADDLDYFADAYLSVTGAELDKGKIGDIKKSRIINVWNNGSDVPVDIKFLEKPSADETQEHAIDRVTNLIFQISMVANINDEIFGNATSGRSLEYKLLSMRNLTSNKERKFTKQLRALFNIVGAINSFGNGINLGKDVEFNFVRNLPNNNAEEAQTAATLSGIVSQETQLSTLSIVKDPQEEMKKITIEDSERIKNARKSGGLDYDFQKNNSNSDDDTQDNQKTNTSQTKDE